MKRVALFGTVLMTGLLLGACSQQTASQSSDNTDQSAVSVSLKKRESRVAKREKQVSKDSSSLATSASQSAATTSSSASSASDQSSAATSTATSTSAASVTSDKMSQTATASQSSQNTTSTSSTSNATTPTQPTTVDGNQAIKLVVQQAGQKFGQSVSYLNNGLITRGGQQGYLINIYAPNEDSPRAGYFVTQSGQVEQIW